MTTWISIGKVGSYYGVTTQTIRNWTKQGEFEAVRTIGEHRRYKKEETEAKLGIVEEEKYTVCYSRVSANDQREDLKRQSKELQNYCEEEKIEKVEVIEEVGSGMNYKKRGLKN